MGQGHIAAGIAHGIQPVREIAVKNVLRGEAHGIQAQTPQPRSASGGDQHLVHVHIPHRGFQAHGPAVNLPQAGVLRIVPTACGHRGVEHHVHAVGFHPVQDAVPRERFVAGQQIGTTYQQCDSRPETGQPRGGLAGNYPATHDRHPFGNLDHPGRIRGGPHVRTLELRRHLGFAAGRKDHGVPRGDGARRVVVVVDPDGTLPDQASVAADHVDPGRFRPVDL